jgi:hypothetical protein
MNSVADELDRTEHDILTSDVSDDALERAAGSGRQDMANPTVPSAIFCVPLEAE